MTNTQNVQNEINEAVYGGEPPEPTTEDLLEAGLVELLEGTRGEIGDALVEGEIRSIQTYADAGVMTRDRGLVLTMVDGSEYQINIGRSR